MSSIVTFYSYKGGVGRSMALANVALLLAMRGKRVLVVDWDLEAPGLERYFSYFPHKPRPGGLLPLFARAMESLTRKTEMPAYRDHLWEVALKHGPVLSMIPSGRDNHANYARMLQEFSWRDFFEAGGGDFIEKLRNEWLESFDITLVDSRTGMSDAGGICTIQVPDVLVTMFTANYQSINGVRDIIDAAQRGRQRLAYDRMPLTVVPLLSRFSAGTEIQESTKWLDTIADTFDGVCDDWRPPWLPLRGIFERLKVPQIDWYGFGERLAVVEQGVSDPGGMGYGFDRLADLLGSEFKDLEGAFGSAARKPNNWTTGTARSVLDGARLYADGVVSSVVDPRPPNRPTVDSDYEYDLFVSYKRGGVVDEWVDGFIADLSEWLREISSREPRIFLDRQVGSHQSWSVEIERALKKSKLLLAILTPSYFASSSCAREWLAFEQREEANGGGLLIFPVVVQGDSTSLPVNISKRTHMVQALPDALMTLRNRERNTFRLAQTAAFGVNDLLLKVPPYDPNRELPRSDEGRQFQDRVFEAKS